MEHPRPAYDDRLLYGAAYYPEYFPLERRERDLDLMAQAGISVIRVGESVWSTWEPTDGEFDLEWLRPTLDGALERGIAAILGTPTYAVPPWMQKQHPEIAAENATGQRVPWGGRQEVDYTASEFRRRAERVIRAILDTYGSHEAVIGYQVDNEPGIHLLHNDHVFQRFRRELKAEYGSPDALNEAWGLVYWSHQLTSFDELWRPDGNTLPQYDLAWRRFQTRVTTEFIQWQADIIREYAAPHQFVTTCVAYSRSAVDDVRLATGLDVNAANLYYGMQDHLDLRADLPRVAPWTTSGVWGFLQAADRAFATTQKPFLVTETNAQSIGGSDVNYPPYPGQLRQSALALVSRGARMVEYWHWNTIPYGTETFWGGVLPHSGEPGRVYDEVARVAAELTRLSPLMAGYTPDHDVTFLVSNDSRWAFDFFPPIPNAPSREHGGAYGVIFSAFYRGATEARCQAALLNDSQARELSAEDLVARHPILVVPALYVAEDALLEHLAAYAEAGGHLVIGMRTGYADQEARSRTTAQPGILNAHSGTWYEESSNLQTPLPLTAVGDFPLPDDARATVWVDGLIATDADVLLEYDHHAMGRFAALTTRAHGAGRVTHVGTIPNPALSAALVNWLTASDAPRWALKGTAVTAHSGKTSAGDRVWFVHNWSPDEVSVPVPAGMTDAASGERLDGSRPLRLAGWDCAVFVERS